MLNKLNKIYFEVATSKINGVGLISIRDIPKIHFYLTHFACFQVMNKKNIINYI